MSGTFVAFLHEPVSTCSGNEWATSGPGRSPDGRYRLGNRANDALLGGSRGSSVETGSTKRSPFSFYSEFLPSLKGWGAPYRAPW